MGVLQSYMSSDHDKEKTTDQKELDCVIDEVLNEQDENLVKCCCEFVNNESSRQYLESHFLYNHTTVDKIRQLNDVELAAMVMLIDVAQKVQHTKATIQHVESTDLSRPLIHDIMKMLKELNLGKPECKVFMRNLNLFVHENQDIHESSLCQLVPVMFCEAHCITVLKDLELARLNVNQR